MTGQLARLAPDGWETSGEDYVRLVNFSDTGILGVLVDILSLLNYFLLGI